MLKQAMITGKTAVYGILGDPVVHSLSPQMHAAFATALGIDMTYVPFPVRPADFPDALRGLGLAGVKGLNITLPHKEAALALATETSSATRAIGAVNTLVWEGRGYRGHNTDAPGFMRALDETGLPWQGKNALVIGAGGAARAILWALGEAGAPTIHLANRTLARAQALAAQFSHLPIQAIALEEATINPLLDTTYLIVNTSSRGLHGETHPELDLSRVPSTGIICDIVYNPIETPLLAEARRHGLRTVDGLGMLVHQGAESFYLWMGKRPDTSSVKEELGRWLASAQTTNR